MELLPLLRNNQDQFAEVTEFVMDCYLARSEREVQQYPYTTAYVEIEFEAMLA
jgi:hypothetical protein